MLGIAVGVGVAVIIALLLLLVLAVMFRRRTRSSRQPPADRSQAEGSSIALADVRETDPNLSVGLWAVEPDFDQPAVVLTASAPTHPVQGADPSSPTLTHGPISAGPATAGILQSRVWGQHTLPPVSSAEIELGECIGQGTFADVYEGRWRGSVVVVKQFCKIREPVIRSLAKREIEMVLAMQHPNIIRFIGLCDELPHKLWLLTEKMSCSLEQRLDNSRPPLTRQESMSIACQIALGMQFLHRLRVMHCDLKPANVLLERVRAGGGERLWDLQAPGGVSRQHAGPRDIRLHVARGVRRVELVQHGRVGLRPHRVADGYWPAFVG